MNEQRGRSVRKSLVALLTLASFVFVVALTVPALAKGAKAPGEKRGKKKDPAGQADPSKKKSAKGDTVPVSKLDEATLAKIFAGLDTADPKDAVNAEEFKALPTVIKDVLAAAPKVGKQGGGKKGGKKKDPAAAAPDKKEKGGKGGAIHLSKLDDTALAKIFAGLDTAEPKNSVSADEFKALPAVIVEALKAPKKGGRNKAPGEAKKGGKKGGGRKNK